MALWAAAGQQAANLVSWIKWSIEISAGYSKSMSTPSRVVILALCVIWVMIFLATLFMKIMREPRFSAKSGFSLMMLPITYALWKQGFVRAGANTDIYILFQPIAFAMLSMERIVQTDPEIKIFQRKLPFVLVFLFFAMFMFLQTNGHIADDITRKPLIFVNRSMNVIRVITGNIQDVLPAVRRRSEERCSIFPASARWSAMQRLMS
jgi:hypothetical protein